MGKHADGPRARGDKLATWRTRRDRTGLRTPLAMAAIQGPARAWCRPWLAQAPGWRAGARLLEDRGCSDGATRSALKRQRQGDVILPLHATMLATQEAIPLAALATTWQPPPSRAAQTLALGRGVAPRWTEWAVPLHACVMRLWNKQNKCPDPLVLSPTELQLRASWIVRHDAERPEMAPDSAQMQRGGGQLHKRRATRESAMVFAVRTVGLR